MWSHGVDLQLVEPKLQSSHIEATNEMKRKERKSLLSEKSENNQAFERGLFVMSQAVL